MRLRFGDCVFDSDTRELLRGGSPVPLTPKAFQLLEILVAERPKALSKAALHDRLWPGTFVTDSNLVNLVADLRVAIGDDARHPSVIRTLPRYGYAFSAPATLARSPGGGDEAPRDRVYRLVWGRREFTLAPGENLVGRDRDAVVCVEDESVSRRHARISIGDGEAWIEDLNSKNGTFLRGERIRAAARLSHRDVVQIGPATLRLRVVESAGSTRSAARRLAPR